MNDLLEEIDLLPVVAPQRRWTDQHAERRAITRPSPNGHVGTYTHVCSGCGQEFDTNRRQVPGKHVWCGKPECKKEAAAQRAREFRKRQQKEEN